MPALSKPWFIFPKLKLDDMVAFKIFLHMLKIRSKLTLKLCNLTLVENLGHLPNI